jgi:microcystin-dependent protein
MGMPIPTVGVEPGPDWASDINSSLGIIDAHNHVPGQGAPVPTEGLNINADLTFGGYNATNLRTVRLAAQSSVPSLSTDLNAVYSLNGDLYFRDGNAFNVQITNAGSVVGAPGNITNLSLPASVTYVSLSKTFVFQSDVSTSAILDGSSVILRKLTASSPGLTLSPPSSMTVDYTLTLPALPASTALMTMDTGGAMGTTIPNSTISNSAGVLKVADNSLTDSQVAPGYGFVPSGVILPYGGTSAPSGFLLCDGTSYLKASYPNLYAIIGDAFGTADATHFNVPDLRGQFLRGVSGASSNDPDKLTRTAMTTGGNTGNNVGSVQTDAFKSHTHNVQLYDDSGTNGLGAMDRATTFVGPLQATTATGGSETRPINAYVNYIIKV